MWCNNLESISYLVGVLKDVGVPFWNRQVEGILIKNRILFISELMKYSVSSLTTETSGELQKRVWNHTYCVHVHEENYG